MNGFTAQAMAWLPCRNSDQQNTAINTENTVKFTESKILLTFILMSFAEKQEKKKERTVNEGITISKIVL